MIAALNLLTDRDHVVTYINALIQVKRPEGNEEKFWFRTPEQPDIEDEHSPIQKRILTEQSEFKKLDPTENEESRTKFLTMFKWTDSQITGTDREIF